MSSRNRSRTDAPAALLTTLAAAGLLAGCATRSLPPYEPPLAHTALQTVRTTAYTHTEADHLEYGNRNALGGTLRAAGPGTQVPAYGTAPAPVPAASYPAAAAVDPAEPRADDAGGSEAYGFRPSAKRRDFETGAVAPAETGASGYANASYGAPIPAVCGSAASDWSRWPAGTVFRVLETGQVYKIDDYGWALSGRNTIDLYMPTRATMNAWGERRVPIQILAWGDRAESLRVLKGREQFRHLRRMVLELEGNARAAARMR